MLHVCLLNIRKSGPSPLSTTTGRTDPWEDGSLGNIQKDGGRRYKGKSGRGKHRPKPQTSPSLPMRHIPRGPPHQRPGRSGLRSGSQEASPPPGPPSKSSSHTKATGRQGANMGFLNASSLMPPWISSIPSSSHSHSCPGLEITFRQST